MYIPVERREDSGGTVTYHGAKQYSVDGNEVRVPGTVAMLAKSLDNTDDHFYASHWRYITQDRAGGRIEIKFTDGLVISAGQYFAIGVSWQAARSDLPDGQSRYLRCGSISLW